MVIGLLIVLLLVLVMPLVSKIVEHNLEAFLLVMGLAASIISKVLTGELVLEVFQNKFMYAIALMVLIGGFLFRLLNEKLSKGIEYILSKMSIKIFVFLLVVILGLLSSVITAIIAALVLVEIINILPLSRKEKINVDIIACFSIGLGAVLTPIGEPLSTIVVSKLDVGFGYLMQLLGTLIIPGIIAFGIICAFMVGRDKGTAKASDEEKVEAEGYKDIGIRTVKVFIFIIALELLGAGFKPLIDTYVIKMSSMALYWLNMVSAILDNATLASAEISSKMTQVQIKAILLGLLISGGMMIPGNIPNIISASKLKISSKEWVKLGIPLGAITLIVYFVILFFI